MKEIKSICFNGSATFLERKNVEKKEESMLCILLLMYQLKGVGIGLAKILQGTTYNLNWDIKCHKCLIKDHKMITINVALFTLNLQLLFEMETEDVTF